MKKFKSKFNENPLKTLGISMILASLLLILISILVIFPITFHLVLLVLILSCAIVKIGEHLKKEKRLLL